MKMCPECRKMVKETYMFGGIEVCKECYATIIECECEGTTLNNRKLYV